MEGLSAKVFRTYNASYTLQEQLAKTEQEDGWSLLSEVVKMDKYNDANRMVAILCNHQKSVSSAGQATIEAATAKIVLLKEQKKVLKGILKLV